MTDVRLTQETTLAAGNLAATTRLTQATTLTAGNLASTARLSQLVILVAGSSPQSKWGWGHWQLVD